MKMPEKPRSSWSVKNRVNPFSFEEGSLQRTMEVIPLIEAEANLSRCGRLCQEEPIIVSVKGVPAFQLAPRNDDDSIDRLLAHNPEFRRMLESRAEEPTVPLETALERL